MKRFIWKRVNVPVCSLTKLEPESDASLEPDTGRSRWLPVTYDLSHVHTWHLLNGRLLFSVFFVSDNSCESWDPPHSSLLCQHLTALVALCNINSGNWGHPSLCLFMFVLCCSPVSPGGHCCTNVSFFWSDRQLWQFPVSGWIPWLRTLTSLRPSLALSASILSVAILVSDVGLLKWAVWRC